MLFRFNKIVSILMLIIIVYFYNGQSFSVTNSYGVERHSLGYFFHIVIILLIWNLVMRTYNYVCFGMFKDVLLMSKKEFENIKYKKN